MSKLPDTWEGPAGAHTIAALLALSSHQFPLLEDARLRAAAFLRLKQEFPDLLEDIDCTYNPGVYSQLDRCFWVWVGFQDPPIQINLGVWSYWEVTRSTREDPVRELKIPSDREEGLRAASDRLYEIWRPLQERELERRR